MSNFPFTTCVTSQTNWLSAQTTMKKQEMTLTINILICTTKDIENTYMYMYATWVTDLVYIRPMNVKSGPFSIIGLNVAFHGKTYFNAYPLNG